jgi:hypothetical protein
MIFFYLWKLFKLLMEDGLSPSFYALFFLLVVFVVCVFLAIDFFTRLFCRHRSVLLPQEAEQHW